MEKPENKNYKKMTRRKFLELMLVGAGAALANLAGCSANEINRQERPVNPTNTPTLGVEKPTTQATQEITSIPTLSIQTPEPTEPQSSFEAVTPSPTTEIADQKQQNLQVEAPTDTSSTLVPDLPPQNSDQQNATPTPSTLQPMAELAPESKTVMSRCHDIISVEDTLQSTPTEEGTATLTCTTVDGNRVRVIISIGIGQHVPTTGQVTSEKRIGDQLHTITTGWTTYHVKSFYTIQ